MRIFKIIQKNDRYNVHIEDFEGYFLLEKDGNIQGFLNEPYHGITKYIFGKYNEKEEKMFFFKLTNLENIAPLLFVFKNINEDGVKFSIALSKFFVAGKRKIEIQEEELTKEIQEVVQKELKNFMTNCIEQNRFLIRKLSELEKNIY